MPRRSGYDPIANGLRARLELFSEQLRATAGSDELDHLHPELGCIGWTGTGHRDSLAKTLGCPPNRINSSSLSENFDTPDRHC